MTKLKNKKKKSKLMTRKEIIEFLHECDINDDTDNEFIYFNSGSIAKPSDFIPIAWDTPY